MNTIQLNESDIQYMVTECVKRIVTEDIEEGKFGKFLGTAALGAALAMGTPTPANAQLNIQNQVAQEPQKLLSYGINDNVMYKTENYGYIIQSKQYGISKSDAEAIASMFSPDGITIVLGNNEKSALLTLYDLKHLIENNIHTVTFSQKWLGDEELLELWQYKQLGVKGLQIQKVNTSHPVAGYGVIFLQMIEDAIRYFNDTFYVDDELTELQSEYNKLRKLYYGTFYQEKATDNPTEKEMFQAQMKKIHDKMDEIESTINAMKRIPSSSKPIDNTQQNFQKNTITKEKKNFNDGIYGKRK